MTNPLNTHYHCLAERHVVGLSSAVSEFHRAVSASDHRKLAIVSSAVTFGVATKYSFMKSASVGFAALAASLVKGWNDSSKKREEIRELLESMKMRDQKGSLITYLALSDLDGLLSKGYTKPTTKGEFAYLHGSALCLGLSSETERRIAARG